MQEETNINTNLLKLIKESLGFTKKSRTVIYTDLDHLAGTWSEKDSMDFQKCIADFEKIDEDMWK